MDNETKMGLITLCVDAVRGSVKNYANGKEGKTDEKIREGFLNILGIDSVDKISFHLWNRHSDEIYEVMETSLNITLPDAWNTSTFYQELVEIKNGALDQKNEFIVNDPSTLIVSRFSGNHWDIDRQKLPVGRTFSLATEWYGVMIYDEWERFMKGITNVVQMFTAIREAFQRAIDEHIYSAFNGAGTYLPTQFKESGSFNKQTLLNLAVRVQTAAGRAVRFAGTRQALAKLEGAVENAWVSNEMKNEKNQFGYLKVWEGYNTIEIPQTFNHGTYDFKSPDNIIYILPVDYKFIKLWFEGETRVRELNQYQNHDQTISVQAQTKMGIGVVFDTVFGEYEVV